MQCDILTIFPQMIDSYCSESILKRAQEDGVVTITAHNVRDYTDDKHKTVDDTPYGGGAGMVMKVEPIFKAVEGIKDTSKKTRTILLSAKGKRFTQADAQRLADYEQLILIAGRYEGVDERVAQHIADEEISIGDFVLTGGELGALVIADAVTRLLPGALGNEQSAIHESHSSPAYREHPHYTKPESFNGWDVPTVLLSGDHAAVEQWRTRNARGTLSENKN